MRLLLVFIFGLISTGLFSQQPIKELTAQNWSLAPLYSSASAIYDYNMGVNGLFYELSYFPDAQITASPSEKIAVIANSTFEYGIIRINDNLQIKWNQQINGVVTGMGIFNGKLLVIHIDKSQEREIKETVCRASLLDMSTGKVLNSKIIYQSSAHRQMDISCFILSESSQFYLGVRQTELETGVTPKLFNSHNLLQKFKNTTRYDVITFDQNLAQKESVEVPVKKDYYLQSVKMNSRRELLILYLEKLDAFHLQQIGSDFRSEESLITMPADVKSGYAKSAKIFIGKQNPSTVYVACSYKNKKRDDVNSLFRVDLDKKSTRSLEQVVDKEFKKTVKSNYTRYSNNSNDLNIASLNDLEYIDLQEVGDKIVVYQEVVMKVMEQSSFSNFYYYFLYVKDGLLSVYDQQLKLTDQKLIPKYQKYEGTFKLTSGIHINDNKVYIASMIKKGINLPGRPFFVEYDLNQKKITKEIVLNLTESSRASNLIPEATLWFEKSFLFTCDRIVVTNSRKINTDMLLYSY